LQIEILKKHVISVPSRRTMNSRSQYRYSVFFNTVTSMTIEIKHHRVTKLELTGS